eukprot:6028814-Prymnesium_polylepis.1
MRRVLARASSRRPHPVDEVRARRVPAVKDALRVGEHAQQQPLESLLLLLVRPHVLGRELHVGELAVLGRALGVVALLQLLLRRVIPVDVQVAHRVDVRREGARRQHRPVRVFDRSPPGELVLADAGVRELVLLARDGRHHRRRQH